MEVLGMADLNDTPSEDLIPSDIHTFSKTDKAHLHKCYSEYYPGYMC
jgi:hypothetical protein